MPDYLEIWKPSGPEALPLVRDKVAIGKSRSNDLVITGDETISRAHAVLERLASGWTLRDLGSRNGSFVNGERVHTERVLRPGDEVRLGGTRLVFRGTGVIGETAATEGGKPPPDLTRRERDVLAELCRPLVSGDLFTEPASIREIAKRLHLTEATIKQHLIHLYGKFGLHESGQKRRAQLANDAIHRGALSVADLKNQA